MVIDLDPKRLIAIPDLQIPFEHGNALKECQYIKRHFGIPDHRVYNLGDETDQNLASEYDDDPDGDFSPKGELLESIEKLKLWYEAFPLVKVNISNHGQRYWRKASKAGLPSLVLKSIKEVFQAPEGWEWAKRWDVNDFKYPVTTLHGDQFKGPMPHIKAAQTLVRSVIIGHHHTKAGVHYMETDGYKIFAAAGGSLIDFSKYAFKYGWDAVLKPKIGVTIVLDDGERAEWIPIK